MKKIFLSLALVFGMVATAAAQVNLGGRIAGTMSTFTGEDAEDVDFWGVGFNAGIAAKYNINEMLAVAPELGVDFRRIADDEVTFSFWVLEIPVMIRVSPMPNLYIEGGPTIGFILSNGTDYDLPEELEGVTMMGAEDIGGAMFPKDTKTLEVGLALGVGYTVIPNLDVNFRFAMGFTNVFDDIDLGPLAPTQEVDMQNLQLSIGATYWFM